MTLTLLLVTILVGILTNLLTSLLVPADIRQRLFDKWISMSKEREANFYARVAARNSSLKFVMGFGFLFTTQYGVMVAAPRSSLFAVSSLVTAFVAYIFLRELVSVINVDRLIRRYEQLKALSWPYADAGVLFLMDARFAAMTSKKDYDVIMHDLQKLIGIRREQATQSANASP